MNLLKEMKALGFPIESATPTIRCEVFEDNSGALEIATVHKFRPRTKHINTKYHHFREFVSRKEVIIKAISSSQQRADYLTKPLRWEDLSRLRPMVMGW